MFLKIRSICVVCNIAQPTEQEPELDSNMHYPTTKYPPPPPPNKGQEKEGQRLFKTMTDSKKYSL
jgi:hypothetical protein